MDQLDGFLNSVELLVRMPGSLAPAVDSMSIGRRKLTKPWPSKSEASSCEHGRYTDRLLHTNRCGFRWTLWVAGRLAWWLAQPQRVLPFVSSKVNIRWALARPHPGSEIGVCREAQNPANFTNKILQNNKNGILLTDI
jgi:hypothetical protein